MRIYTKTGDDGTTGLYGGGRICKSHLRIQAIGDVDELNAQIGWTRTLGFDKVFDHQLEQVQRVLFVIGADLATPTTWAAQRTGPAAVSQLEKWIDAASAQLEPLKKFILPGGAPTAAALHLARTICRRAERSVVALGVLKPIEQPNPEICVYLNRLSDLLFVWARLENLHAGVEEAVW
jgi:cob(I)alamin adenosyltransferase